MEKADVRTRDDAGSRGGMRDSRATRAARCMASRIGAVSTDDC